MPSAGDPSETVALDAWRFLRRHFSGLLHFDEHTRPLGYAPEPGGMLVAPVMVAMLESVDVVLFVPDDSEGCMEVMVGLEPFDELGPLGGLADRWRIYHGEPPDVRWARLSIEAARFEGYIIDGAALMRPNPVAGIEAAACRAMNGARRDDLREAVTRAHGVVIENPMLVGMDDHGLDVRGTVGVYRLEVAAPIDSLASAERALDELVR